MLFLGDLEKTKPILWDCLLLLAFSGIFLFLGVV
jgi:hypothetical protein